MTKSPYKASFSNSEPRPKRHSAALFFWLEIHIHSPSDSDPSADHLTKLQMLVMGAGFRFGSSTVFRFGQGNTPLSTKATGDHATSGATAPSSASIQISTTTESVQDRPGGRCRGEPAHNGTYVRQQRARCSAWWAAHCRRCTAFREARGDGFSGPVPHLDRSDWDIRGVTKVANAKQSAGGHGRCGVNRGSNSRDDLLLASGNLSGTSDPQPIFSTAGDTVL